MNEFTPKVIGLPDQKKADQITTLYSEICTDSNSLYWSMEAYLDSFDQLDLQEFLNFLDEKDPKAWLYLKYIEYHGLQFPGIAISKIIEYQLVDVPVDHFEDILKSRAALLAKIEKTKEYNFFYPLAKLFTIVEGYQGFAITKMDFGLVATEFDPFEFKHTTPDFDERLYNYVRKFTASERENEALKVIENAVNALNDLVSSGIIRNEKQKWGNDLNDFIRAIVFSLNEEKPLSINPNLPKFKGFGKHFEPIGWSQIKGSTKDVLKFEASAPEQIEYFPEDLLQNEDSGAEQIEEIPEEIIQAE